MTFVRASLLNAVAVAVRMLSALVVNKVLAISIGPSGFALIGQFQNAVSILTTFATAATGQGITKYTAEYAGDAERQRVVWRTAGTLTLATSLLTGLGTVAARSWLAGHFLHDRSQAFVFAILGVGLVLLAMNAFVIAILNGQKEIRTFVIISALGSLLGLVFTVTLAVTWGLRGALAALAFNQSLTLIVTIALCRSRPWFRPAALFGKVDRGVLGKLGGFVAMAATGAIAGPLAQIAIRGDLIALFGRVHAGEWEAMMRISSLYLLFFTSTLSVYYLPRISELQRRDDLAAEVFHIFRLAVPVVLVASLSVYLLRDIVIQILFARDFTGMRDLFAWQMVGDTLKATSWVFAYVMVGRAMTMWFIATEVGFNLAWVAGSYVAVRTFGFAGISLGYAGAYGLYLVAVLVIFHRYLGRMGRFERRATAERVLLLIPDAMP